MKNPPCCIPLQKATKIIAIINLVAIGIALLILKVSFVVIALNYSNSTIPGGVTIHSNSLDIFGLKGQEEGHEHGSHPADNYTLYGRDGSKYYHEKLVVTQILNMAMSYFTVIIVFLAFAAVINFHLWKGANEKNIPRIQVWFHCGVVNTFISLFMGPVLVAVITPQYLIPLGICVVLQTCVALYILWIVLAFMKEIEDSGKSDDKKDGADQALVEKEQENKEKETTAA